MGFLDGSKSKENCKQHSTRKWRFCARDEYPEVKQNRFFVKMLAYYNYLK
jgi:hypothetical protein